MHQHEYDLPPVLEYFDPRIDGILASSFQRVEVGTTPGWWYSPEDLLRYAGQRFSVTELFAPDGTFRTIYEREDGDQKQDRRPGTWSWAEGRICRDLLMKER